MKRKGIIFSLILVLLLALCIPAGAETSSQPAQGGPQPGGDPMKSQLDSLVSAGTITQAQEDAVLEAIKPGEKPAQDNTAGGSKQDFSATVKVQLDSLVSSGVITQSQEDAIQAALKPPTGGPSSSPPAGDPTMSKPLGDNAQSANAGGIVLKIGSSKMTVNGTEKDVDPGYQTAPVIQNGTTYIPVRAVIESLGGTVEWNSADKSTTITLNNTPVILQIGSSSATVNGLQKELNGTPFISETGRTMLPLRFITENLGHGVSWDASSKTITIN